MSRMDTTEHIDAKRRAYAEAGSTKRHRLLDEVCKTTGYARKYANRLLTGNRKFRDRKGRGKTLPVRSPLRSWNACGGRLGAHACPNSKPRRNGGSRSMPPRSPSFHRTFTRSADWHGHDVARPGRRGTGETRMVEGPQTLLSADARREH